MRNTIIILFRSALTRQAYQQVLGKGIFQALAQRHVRLAPGVAKWFVNNKLHMLTTYFNHQGRDFIMRPISKFVERW